MNLEQLAVTSRSKGVRDERNGHVSSAAAIGMAVDAQDLAIRALDLALVVCGLIVLLPVFLAIAMAIKLDSPGPVLFVQKRVGRDGRIFNCFKFRSMRTDAEALRKRLEQQNERSGPVFKMRNDPRVTGVGRFLRRSSLDELPQLLNVLFGDMSLVGPRPAIPSEVAQYTDHQVGRLAVVPGLTGLWQVSGRASLSFESMIELDLLYVQQRCLWTNIRILALTIPAVVSGRGAY
ncbi:MAG: sugar transferase [Capsulimonadaceae bacterium]|nr:sugar transferase [Capsulimonadaceae bacterium]